ncbi:MAG: MFS transporter, partial [Phormidesmis sp.]
KQTALASVPWFFQDIATYGIGIFTPTIIAALAFSQEQDLLRQEMASARGAAIVNVFLVMGFLLAVLLINRVGRISLQMLGFIGMAIGLGVLSFSGDRASGALLFTGFIVFNLTMNLGPNSTTFLLSGEVFPPAIRASGAGLAGAIAKSGAVIGALGLPILQESAGVAALLRLLAGFCLIAAAITYVLRQAASENSREEIHEEAGKEAREAGA